MEVDIKPNQSESKTSSFSGYHEASDVIRAQTELARSLQGIAGLPATQARYDVTRMLAEGARAQVEASRTETTRHGDSRSEPNQSEPVISNSVPFPRNKQDIPSMHMKDFNAKMLIQSKSLGRLPALKKKTCCNRLVFF